jgi:gamma-glutamylcyclotransferase (GGCT)/AIG2-like uncharacterized protein YtfP/cation transport regulator ChaC
MHKLFVYGTLRGGESNHGLLGAPHCVSLLAQVSGFMVDTGFGYPAMIEGSGKVCGEIYEIDEETLLRIDALEAYYGPGDPRNLYERVETAAYTDQGEVKVMTYVSSRFSYDSSIPYGDWKLYQMTKLQHVLYFAYGSCMDDARFKEHGVSEWFSDVIGRGRVFGCNVQFTRHAHNGGRADLVETGGVTEGKLYRIPVAVLEGYLYGREGVQSEVYRPVVIPVTLDNHRVVDAVTFVVVDKKTELAPPQEYMEEMLRGAKPIVSSSYYEALLDRFISVFGYREKKD